MVSGIERPLDLLNNSKGKEVLVYLKGDKQFVGTLLAFDKIYKSIKQIYLCKKEGRGNYPQKIRREVYQLLLLLWL